MVSLMTQDEKKVPAVTGKAIIGALLIIVGAYLCIDALGGAIFKPNFWGGSLLGFYIIQGIIGLLSFGGGLHFWQKRND